MTTTTQAVQAKAIEIGKLTGQATTSVGSGQLRPLTRKHRLPSRSTINSKKVQP